MWLGGLAKMQHKCCLTCGGIISHLCWKRFMQWKINSFCIFMWAYFSERTEKKVFSVNLLYILIVSLNTGCHFCFTCPHVCDLMNFAFSWYDFFSSSLHFLDWLGCWDGVGCCIPQRSFSKLCCRRPLRKILALIGTVTLSLSHLFYIQKVQQMVHTSVCCHHIQPPPFQMLLLLDGKASFPTHYY